MLSMLSLTTNWLKYESCLLQFSIFRPNGTLPSNHYKPLHPEETDYGNHSNKEWKYDAHAITA